MTNVDPVAAEAAITVEDLCIRYGGVTAVENVSFTAGRGQQLTLLGPSGCGKTTTLRAVAGLERPTSGRITVLGKAMFDSARGIDVPAEQRGMSMVFQSYAIWPHMTVFDNVAYGLRVRKEGGAALHEKVMAALDLVKMSAFAKRNASQLSGGQQQRVALARAFAFSPSVLLFDEPLSNLDAKLRAEMRIELRELQRRLGVTSLYVTHDLEEALAMSDRIVVMRTGKIEQIGTASDIYDRPRTAFVADFVGSANLVAGRPIERAASSGRIAVDVGGAVLQGVTLGRRVGDEVTLSLRTVHLRLHKTSPSPDHGNVWPVTISKSVFLGDLTQVHVIWSGRELVVRESIPHRYAANQSAFLTIAPENCVVLES
jgi:ABC-type Fe3+/spermidine/putrescine transport system ATPase subunit